MGLIKAVTSTVTSTIAEMWEDYIYCDSMSNDILIQKGIARKAGGNEKAGGNVITDGSRIAVNAGQFMIIVENGKLSILQLKKVDIYMIPRQNRHFSAEVLRMDLRKR